MVSSNSSFLGEAEEVSPLCIVAVSKDECESMCGGEEVGGSMKGSTNRRGEQG